MALRAGRGQARAVPWLSSYSYIGGPLVALGVVGILVLLLRWTFSRGGSLVEKPVRPGTEKDYGLLVAIASPGTHIEGEMLRRTLEDAGVRATLAQTTEGPRLMVFRRDEVRARQLLASR